MKLRKCGEKYESKFSGYCVVDDVCVDYDCLYRR